MPKIIRIFRFTKTDWMDYFSFFFLLIYFRFLVSFFSMNKYLRYIGKQGVETLEEIEESQTFEVLRVKKMAHRFEKYLNWVSTCLTLALCSAYLIRNKNIPCTIYLGVKKDSNSMKAHAWCRCGSIFVSGHKVKHQFTVVSYFGR